VLGDRRLAELTTIDLASVVRAAGDRSRASHPDGSGRSAEETCVAALRALCARAVATGHLTTDPAAALAKPRRTRSRRRALDDGEVADLADAVRLTSRDPDLDLLLLRFHLETGARRQGALNLRRRDIDLRRGTLWLREKNGDQREQPASPTLLAALERLARQRRAGEAGSERVLCGPAGSPITARHYDTLFARARSALGWDPRTPVSAHVLRHTAVTNVARIAGYAVAQAFAGHTPPTVTGRYIHATLAEVAAAVAALTGEPHPLAGPHLRRRCGR
jgi:integrase